MSESIKSKCKKIKLVLTDVDGVLTDGGRYYSEKGEIVKRFHVRDGMGINILLRNGIKTAIITKENSKIVKKWAKEMNVSKTYGGIKIKEKELEKICQFYKILPNEIAFIGDDVNDVQLMKKVGFSVTPSDGILQAKKIANYICKTSGGNGALREMIDLILKEKLKLNGKVINSPSHKVLNGDKINLEIPEANKTSLKPFNFKLNIIYEDDDLLVINKPAGIIMHPGAGNYDNTIVNALMHYCEESLSNDSIRLTPYKLCIWDWLHEVDIFHCIQYNL